ncbi:class C sortase [Peptococcus simiae]|uniref:Class C sortase n=1 Tax=Peptococcus simiae TaxID=1643805 RepID=A0ABW9H115_9FIRM
MQREKTALLSLLLMLLGLLILCYPVLGSFVNGFTQSRAIVHYSEKVEALSPEEREALLRGAQAYNLALQNNPAAFYQPDLIPGYEDILNPGADGLMAYVTIPAIRVKLPIYHGVSEPVLQVGAGHLSGTAFPIGGPGNHAVISGHSGLPTARLFTDLPKLTKGDSFTVHVLDQAYKYKIISIQKVTPEQTESLRPVPGRDLCTLFTCTPYGINTHRLLVTGERAPDNRPADLPHKAGLHWPPWLTGYLKIAAALIAFAVNIRLIIKHALLYRRAKKAAQDQKKGDCSEKRE